MRINITTRVRVRLGKVGVMVRSRSSSAGKGFTSRPQCSSIRPVIRSDLAVIRWDQSANVCRSSARHVHRPRSEVAHSVTRASLPLHVWRHVFP